MKYFELALEINGNDFIALGGLGKVLMERKEWVRALEVLGRLSEMRSKDGTVWRRMGDCLKNEGKGEEAEKYYKHAEQLGCKES